MNVPESLAGNYLRKQFQRLECDCITSHSTVRLEGSDLYQVGGASEVCTDGSCPNPGPLDNLASLYVNIIV